jgi:hypothetical protein
MGTIPAGKQKNQIVNMENPTALELSASVYISSARDLAEGLDNQVPTPKIPLIKLAIIVLATSSTASAKTFLISSDVGQPEASRQDPDPSRKSHLRTDENIYKPP